jgi:hypothetical protein
MIESDLKRPLLFIIGIHLVYASLAMVFKQVLLVDSYGYLMQAENILQHGSWYAEDWNAPLLIDYFSIRPPLYASVLALFSLLPFGWVWILVVQNILSIVNCMVVYRFAIELGANSKRVRAIGMVVLLLYPAQFIHANFVMTEIVFQSLFLFLFLALWRFYKQPSFTLSFRIMLLLSVCLLTKPVSLFMPWLALAAMGFSLYTYKQSVKLLLPILGVGLVFHLICLQNKHATGFYHYSSIKYINQLKYNARFALADSQGEAVADSVVARVVKQANSYTDYGQRLECFDSAATAIIKAYPVSFAKVYTKGVIAFFVDPGRFEVYQFFNIKAGNNLGLLNQVQTGGINRLVLFAQSMPIPVLVVLLCNLCCNVFVLLCFVLLIFKVEIPLFLRVLLTVLVLYIAMATGPVGVSRYRVPVAPLLVLATLLVFAKSTFPFIFKRDA